MIDAYSFITNSPHLNIHHYLQVIFVHEMCNSNFHQCPSYAAWMIRLQYVHHHPEESQAPFLQPSSSWLLLDSLTKKYTYIHVLGKWKSDLKLLNYNLWHHPDKLICDYTHVLPACMTVANFLTEKKQKNVFFTFPLKCTFDPCNLWEHEIMKPDTLYNICSLYT